MILFYMAKKFPQSYVKNFEMTTKKVEMVEKKIFGPPPLELPPNFVSYDGTNDVKWNMRYAALVKVSARSEVNFSLLICFLSCVILARYTSH